MRKKAKGFTRMDNGYFTSENYGSFTGITLKNKVYVFRYLTKLLKLNLATPEMVKNETITRLVFNVRVVLPF